MVSNVRNRLPIVFIITRWAEKNQEKNHKKEVYNMKEHEQKVIEAMLTAVGELNEFEMGYFLGYAEAKAQEAERKKHTEADKVDEKKGEGVLIEDAKIF